MGFFYKPANMPVTYLWIETGSYRGQSIAIALEQGYKKIHSVELDTDLAEQVKEKYNNHPQVKLWQGSSVQWLTEMIDPGRRTTFWLDAHYHPIGEKPEVECPLMQELDIITKTQWAYLPYILIDDYNLFVRSTFPEEFDEKQWPKLPEIKEKLSDYHLNINKNVIAAYPKKIRKRAFYA